MKEESVKSLAFVIWQVKTRQGIPSTPEENWEEAKDILSGNRFRVLKKIIELIQKIVEVFAGEENGY